MNTALCIVDMQDYFETSKRVIKEVIKEIRLARRRDSNVFVLEYDKCGPTNQSILDELSVFEPNKVHYITKKTDGGGMELMKRMRAAKIDFKSTKIRFCGVNRCGCVLKTMEDIKFSSVYLISTQKMEFSKRATYCSCGNHCIPKLKREGFKSAK